MCFSHDCHAICKKESMFNVPKTNKQASMDMKANFCFVVKMC